MVLPFVVYAVLLAALLWGLASIITDGEVLRFGPPGTPLGAGPLLLWIPFLAASLLAWTQAICWTPCRRRWNRMWVLLAAVSAHAAVIVLYAQETLSGNAVLALSLIQLPLAYAAAVRGVAMDRRGGIASRLWSTRETTTTAERIMPRPLRLFSSAFDAQTWFERSIHRWNGPSLVLLALPALLIVVPALVSLTGSAEASPEFLARFARAAIIVSPSVLFIIALTTGSASASLRYNPAWNLKDGFSMPAFFAALPMSTGDFVWAKFKVLSVNMGWACVVVLLLCASSVHLGHLLDTPGGWASSLQQKHGALIGGALLALPPVLMVLLALSSAAASMCMVLPGSGWNWINVTYAIVFGLFGVAAAEIARRWGVQGGAPALLGIAVRVMAIVKLCALASLLYYVGSRRLLSWPRLAGITAFWLLTAAACLAALMGYVPDGIFTATTETAIAILIAPILGIVGAPLALQLNRCR
ncbi:MAG: hypothetical protein WDO56_12730 [Gammaproteobacteria bacterium]